MPVKEWQYQTQTKYNKTNTGSVTSPTATITFVEAMTGEYGPEGLRAGANRLAQALEQWAEANHGWRNRSGKAERELTGFVMEENDEFAAVLKHGDDVEYAVYLERDPRLSVLDKAAFAFASRQAGIVAGEIKLALAGRGSKFRHGGSGRFV